MFAKCLFASLLLCLLPLGIQAQSQAGPFEIPFPFVAFDSEFDAGPYRVAPINEYNLRFWHDETGISKYIVKRQGRDVKTDGRDILVFERVGNLHILREIRSGATGRSSTLPLSKKRSELVQVYISQGFRPEPVLIAASW
ncbi:MAG: hypothetical protein M9913_00575 [Bryobacteraceae bacterium]|nr:hypothetical protein [Solibacteraceae bacterium]MCO5349399.1 hypothetical protein [Bryobacteraceae bacterium]